MRQVSLEAVKLHAFPLFAAANDLTRQRFLPLVHVSVVRPHEPIVQEGCRATAVYGLLAGSARGIHVSPDGTQFHTCILRAPAVLGEAEILSDVPTWLQTVRALELCEVAEVPAEIFRRMLQEEPEMARLLLRDVSRSLCRSMVQARALALDPLEARIAHHLIAYAKAYGQHTSRGILVLQKLTLDELAGLTGAARRSVVRVLRGWKNSALLDRVSGYFLIPNLEVLATKAAPAQLDVARVTAATLRQS